MATKTKSTSKPAPKKASRKSAPKVDVEQVVKGLTPVMKDTLTFVVKGKSPSGKGHYPTRQRALIRRGLATGTEGSAKPTAAGKAALNKA
jgi:hypothetical protein